MPMPVRRKFMLIVLSGVVALGVVGTAALAEELLGVITKVDVEGKKLTVISKETKQEVVVTVTSETEQVTPKGSQPLDLAKLEARVKKTQDAGKKGINAKIEHEKGKASKVEFVGKKKAN